MERKYYYRPWKDETLVSALHFMRCRIIREEQPGLEHVDALLRQMDVDPECLPIPRKTPHHFARGGLQRAILDILRDGPLIGAEIARALPPGLDERAAYTRTYQALNRLKKADIVDHDGRYWSVAERGDQ